MRYKIIFLIMIMLVASIIFVEGAEPPKKFGYYVILNLSEGYGYFDKINIGGSAPLDLEHTFNVNGNSNFNGSIYSQENITANYFIGDGSKLTNLPSSSSNMLISNDGYKQVILTNSFLQYWDGTRNREDITSVHTKFFSPGGSYTLLDDNRYVYNDGTRNRKEINQYGDMSISPSGSKTLLLNNSGVFADGSKIATVDDINSNWDTAYGWGDHDGLYSLLNHKTNELYSPDNLKNLTLTNTNLIYQDGTSQRFIIDSTGAGIFSPDGNKVLLVTNTEAYVNGEVILTSSDLPVDRIVSPDTLSNLTINNTGAYLIGNFTVGDERLGVDEGYVYMQSPTKNHNLMVDNTGAFYDGGEIITVSNFPDIDRIISPDTLKDMVLSDNALMYQDGNYARLFVDNTTTFIGTPDGQTRLTLNNANLIFDDGTRDRIVVDDGKTGIYAPDGSYAYLLNGVFVINDGTRNRFLTAPANTMFYGPDGTKTLTLDNSGITISGDTQITGLHTLIGDAVNFKMKAKTIGLKSVIGWYKSDGTRIGWVGHGSSANYDLTLRNEGTGGNIQLIADDGLVYVNDYLKVSTLTGSGNDYVCVNSEGQMFRSSSGC